MVRKKGPDEDAIIIRFGGGLHTRASEEEINDREASGGQNFLLDLEAKQLKPRRPFDLVATAPNNAEIRGGGSLLKADGTVQAFVQAGNTCYEFDGQSFTASPVLKTVNAAAKLRGHWRSHNWTLDDKLLITDLALLETVKEWDGGATIDDIVFKSSPSTNFGSFYAKYCSISNERALFANIKEAGGSFPHMMIGSLRGDFARISVSDRPSSSLSEQDPFFLLTPDLKPINTMVEAFGTVILSTQLGKLFNLEGESSTDFSFKDFYPGSAASGEESMSYTGNDVIYGRPGRIESVSDTNRFGDSESDDLTNPIADQIRNYVGWRVVYNSRLNRVYLFPAGISEVWVYNTSMVGQELSPFMRWKTNHPLAFQPTCVMSMLDPQDGLEYVFMGDAAGNFYRLEGSGDNGDGGEINISVEYLSKLFSIPLNAQAYDFEGWIKYRKDEAATVELVFEYAGERIFNESLMIELPEITRGPYYGGGYYYNDGQYYGTLVGKLSRQPFLPPGQGNEFQVRVKQSGVNDFTITEIGIRFKASTS